MTAMPISGALVPTTRNATIVAELAAAIRRGTAPALTVLAGPTGHGRSTMLAALRDALADNGIQAPLIRCSPHSSAIPLYARLGALGSGAAPEPAPRWIPAHLPGTVHGTPAETAAAVAEALRRAGISTLLIDDAQWLDQHSLAVAEHLIAAGAGLTWVVAAQSPVAGPSRVVVGRLAAQERARVLRLRPLGTAEAAALCEHVLRARCEAELVEELRQLTGGNPAALAAALAEYRQAGAIRVADQHAFLAERPEPAVLPDNHPLVTAIRRMGDEVWSTAKAAAALAPLGAALPDLIASLSELRPSEVDRSLAVLCHAGVLRRAMRGWRFRVPLVANTLVSRLGPYERRHLAQTAVRTLWGAGAECEQPEYYADQLISAGQLVDHERARAELLALAETSVTVEDRERCLRAAANLAADDDGRAAILVRHAVACFRLGAYEQGLHSAERVLRNRPAELSDGDLDELAHILVLIRHALGPDGARGGFDAAESTARRAIGKATELFLCGQCDASVALLERTQTEWRGSPLSAYLGHVVGAQAHLLLGRRDRFERELDAAEGSPVRGHQPDLVGLRVAPGLINGDVDEVDKLLVAHDCPAELLSVPARAVLAMQRGKCRAGEELARKSIALGVVPGHDLTHAALYEWLVSTVIARGRLGYARQVLADARGTVTLLPHLLDAAEAAIAATVGDWTEATICLRRGLDYAEGQGIALGADRLWAQLAEAEFRAGDPAAAHHALAAAVRTADGSGSGGATLRCLVARAIVERDEAAANDALRLACDRNQPLELAGVVVRLGTEDAGHPGMLRRLYESLEVLDVPLHRALLRNVMLARNVAIPGRRQAQAENDRLLATLVAEGLSNRQMAAVLRISEKGVESRLGRLFARIGCRSRVELATAVRDGEFRG